mmetsp:Transcript_17197/g.43854  ORF Transcript_17197/g.43854 Transcript_17197/m.43854 type:complete len:757 (+) Transcript_17197:132-2402(+)
METQPLLQAQKNTTVREDDPPRVGEDIEHLGYQGSPHVQDGQPDYLAYMRQQDERPIHPIDVTLSQVRYSVKQPRNLRQRLTACVSRSGKTSTASTAAVGQSHEAYAVLDEELGEEATARLLPTVEILHGIDLHVPSGTLLAVCGASGAGKSTLMNVISGRASGKVTGSVLINGQPMRARHMRMISTFIPQDDILHSALTPAEIFDYTAQLCIPDQTAHERRILVDNLIELLRLKKCRDTMVGDELTRGLSGGERKRTSIGVELVSNPSLLFVDEPSSGLDSHTALLVVDTLRSLARTGRTIICTIHQPSFEIFRMFDSLLLLEHGRVAYKGPIASLVPFFEAHGFVLPPYKNPADFMFDVLENTRGQSPNGFPDLWAEFMRKHPSANDARMLKLFPPSEVDRPLYPALRDLDAAAVSSVVSEQLGYGHLSTRINEPTVVADSDSAEPLLDLRDSAEPLDLGALANYQIGFWPQFSTLLRRSAWLSLRDKTQVRAKMALALIVSLFLGLCYFQISYDQSSASDRFALIFSTLIFNAMNNMQQTVTTFPVECAVFLREYRNGLYSAFAFYSSLILVRCTLQAVFTVIFCTVLYFMAGLLLNVTAFFTFLGVHLVVGFIAVVIGLLFGFLIPNVRLATALVPIIMMPLVLFSGFLISRDNVPVYFVWLFYISYLQYSNQILTSSQFSNGFEFNNCTRTFNTPCPYGTGIQPGTKFLGPPINFDPSESLENGGILIAFFGVFLILSFGVLLWRATQKRD